MQHGFFDREINRLQGKFNAVYQDVVVCDLAFRRQVIFAIIGLHLLAKEILAQADYFSRKELIADFVKRRNLIRSALNEAEEQFKQARRKAQPATPPAKLRPAA